MKKKKIPHRQLGPLRGSSSPLQRFEPERAKPNQASIQPKSAGWPAQVNSQRL